jgi:1-aminocyclopropane-1-carboxylate deaminase/D-cysteine desulfhydrase-like pyridoxal-dependent ACC family enzyme
MPHLSKQQLNDWIDSLIDLSYPLHSRIHPLNYGKQWFVKREDELSFGISGSKYRKYASLIPYIKTQGYKEAYLVGSSYSNHLVGMLQLLNEHHITPTVYLLHLHDAEPKGNLGFIKLLLGKHPLHLLSRDDWPHKDVIIKKTLPSRAMYISEGAEMFPSLPGALSLARDIASNPLVFDHLFIDAGTGLSAIALLLGMQAYGLHGKVHIILVAYDEASFLKKLFEYKDLLEKALSCVISLPEFQLYPSFIGKSFGSTNQAIFEEIRSLAQEEGILTDPVYSAKLFYSAKQVHKNSSLQGNILCIHSGGGLTLCGFQKELFGTL